MCARVRTCIESSRLRHISRVFNARFKTTFSISRAYFQIFLSGTYAQFCLLLFCPHLCYCDFYVIVIYALTSNPRLLARLVHLLFDLRVVVRDSFAHGNESLDRQIYCLADSGDRS